MTGFDDGIDFQLALAELAVDGHRAGMVGTIVVQFATGIAERQPAFLQSGTGRIAVHDLAMLREDGGKAGAASQRTGNTVDLSTDETLRHAGLDKQLSRCVHGVADIAGAVDSSNLLQFLGASHFHHRFDKRQRCSLFLLGGMDAQQVHDLYLGIVAVRGEEMDGSVCCCVTATNGTEL